MNRFLTLCLCVSVVTAASLAAATRPEIVDAAKRGDQTALVSLIQKRSNVNATDNDGTTALHWASYRDDLEAAALLIKAGARVNAANDLGATPLWTAAQNGSEKMVDRLLSAGANPNAKLLLGETALMVASRGGYPAVVEQLIAKGADVNARAARGQTALMWAVAQKHPQVVRVLLAHKADLKSRSDVWTDTMAVTPHGYLGYNMAVPHGSDTALLFAARVGDLESAKLLVAAGANVNDMDAWGITPVVFAAHSGFVDVLEFLLDKGADPNLSKAGFPALHIAVMRRDERMAGILLTRGADANAPLRIWTPTRRSSDDFNFEPELVGATPFWLASRFTQPNMMRLLLKHGADPKFVHHSERVPNRFPFETRKETLTTLMAAAGMGGGGATWIPAARESRESTALEAVKMLVELGVNLNAVNNDGRTALDGARGLKIESVVQYLVEKGAKPGTAPANTGGRGQR